MSAPLSQIFQSESELREFAAERARTLQGGEIFALEGELGMGKTVFVKGLAKGLHIPIVPTSPTFNLVHRYTGGRLPLIHYDLYRIKKKSELMGLDLETELEGESVIAIEWPDLVWDLLPKGRTTRVLIEEAADDARRVTIS